MTFQELMELPNGTQVLFDVHNIVVAGKLAISNQFGGVPGRWIQMFARFTGSTSSHQLEGGEGGSTIFATAT